MANRALWEWSGPPADLERGYVTRVTAIGYPSQGFSKKIAGRGNVRVCPSASVLDHVETIAHSLIPSQIPSLGLSAGKDNGKPTTEGFMNTR